MSDQNNEDLHASLARETGGVAGANTGASGESQSDQYDNPEPKSPYKGSVGSYLWWGAAIGAAGGWLIGLAAGVWWLGGLICGAIIGAAIGLYVVETKRF